MPLLNGKSVSAGEIDPAKHRYIGMFRPAECPNAKCNDPKTGQEIYADALICNCGSTLWSVNAIREHYKNGCFDQPQYVDIETDHG